MRRNVGPSEGPDGTEARVGARDGAFAKGAQRNGARRSRPIIIPCAGRWELAGRTKIRPVRHWNRPVKGQIPRHEPLTSSFSPRLFVPIHSRFGLKQRGQRTPPSDMHHFRQASDATKPILFLLGRLQRVVACRRRCSLAFLISFMSPSGRISQTLPYFRDGCCAMSCTA